MDHLRICLQIVKFQLASGNYIHHYVEHLSSRLEIRAHLHSGVMCCMRVCRKQALSRVKYYYYVTNKYSKQQ